MIQEKDLKMGKANQEVFSEILQELAASDRDIIAVTSDSRGSGKMVPYGQKYPDQIVEVGIAEQNLVGVAAGLASAGKKTLQFPRPVSLLHAHWNKLKMMWHIPIIL